MKKNDWILAAGIVTAAVLILGIQLFRSGAGDEAFVSVTVKGEKFGTYSLHQDQAADINGKNRLMIEDGTAWMEWADCPDQICVHHRSISRDGESIICLPNQVVLSIESTEDSDLDGIVR